MRKYRADLEEFGILGFEIREKRGTQGAATEYATLNEQQSTLLLTYMRNENKLLSVVLPPAMRDFIAPSS